MSRISNLAQHSFNLFATLNTPTRLFEAQTEVPLGQNLRILQALTGKRGGS